jgi:hypothetical protein
MSMVEYAESELRRAGMFDEDADYGGELGSCILETIKTFSKYGHSGGSAMISVEILNRLLRWRPLTPITSDPEEWTDRTEMSGRPMWQSKRRPDAFSEDGGQTWYYLDGDE